MAVGGTCSRGSRRHLAPPTATLWLVSFLIELAVVAVALAFFGNIVVLWIPVVLFLVGIRDEM